MKNNSPIYPFDIPGDKYFDSNKDGELKGLETVARDAYWAEQSHSPKEKELFNQTYSSKSSSSGTGLIAVVVIFVFLAILAGIISVLEELGIDITVGFALAVVFAVVEFVIHACLSGKLTSIPKVLTYLFSMVAVGVLLIFLSYLYKYGFHHFYEVINGLEQSYESKYRIMKFNESTIMNTFYISLLVDGVIFIIDGLCSLYKLMDD